MNSYQIIFKELEKIGNNFSLSQPEDVLHGDYATNIALVSAKTRGISSRVLADEIVLSLQEILIDIVEKIEVAGPGFINFFLKDDIRTDEVETIALSDTQNLKIKGKVIVEYTDPNPFKIFHIGHMVPNAIGESISRIYEAEGFEVFRVCYQGDVGMHVATTIWGLRNLKEEKIKEDSSLKERVAYLGRAYAFGTENLNQDVKVKEEIININKKVFLRSDEEINNIYDLGKKWSLDYFETMYKKLGTKFDYYIYESEVGDDGIKVVKENMDKVFEESDGAIVFKGESEGLHTRVFINSQGLPTYEAKEIGNTYKKESLVPENLASIVVTANEIDEYFKIIKLVIGKIDKNLSDKLMHVSHGMLRLPEGKMSSRKGNIIPAEDLIDLVSLKIEERLSEMMVSEDNKIQLLNDIAVGAIKFSILRSAPGKDMIFDFDKSISFEGDSGPYLQYTHARVCALLDKAKDAGIDIESYTIENYERELEQIIIGYNKTLEKSYKDLGPHHIVQYLLSLSRAFNSMYGRVQIIQEDKEKSAYYVMLAIATRKILAHGLYTLGIKAPERM